jgi:hypothetical protein
MSVNDPGHAFGSRSSLHASTRIRTIAHARFVVGADEYCIPVVGDRTDRVLHCLVTDLDADAAWSALTLGGVLLRRVVSLIEVAVGSDCELGFVLNYPTSLPKKAIRRSKGRRIR